MADAFSFTNFVDLASKLLIPLIVGYVTFSIAKRQIRNSGVTQFRQKWIDDLRSAISVFIAKAEVITTLDLDNDQLYNDAFKDLCQSQYKIELLLNPNEGDHNSIIDQLAEIREIVHDEDEINEDELNDAIEKLLDVSKRVLKREWNVVKNGK